MSANTLNQDKIPVLEKVAYLFPELIMSCYYFLILSLCTYFYTDVMMLPAAPIGVIIMVSRFLDLITDLIAGIVIDKTKSKYGKAGGTVLRWIVPLAAFLVIMYMVPAGLSTGAKLAYIFVTYNCTVSLGFTFVNTAWMAIPSMMSSNQNERGFLMSFMLVVSPLGSALGVSVAQPMIAKLGGDQRAWVITMAVFGVIGLLSMIWGAVTCKARVSGEATAEKKIPVKIQLKAAMTSQWWVIFVFSMLQTMFLIGFSTLMTYFSQYFLQDVNFTATINNVQSYTMAAVSVLMLLLSHKFKKINIMKIGLVTAIPAQLIMFINPTNHAILLTSIFARSLGFGFLTTGLFMCLTDVVVWNHWRTGLRTDATTTIAQGTGNKLAMICSSGLFPLLMGLAGYDGALSVQPDSAMTLIRVLFVILPVIIAVLALITCFFYRVDKDWDQVTKDLAAGKFHPDAQFTPEKLEKLIG